MATPVSTVMTRDVKTVGMDDSWLTAVRSIAQHRVHALPVVDGEGRVVGVVAESDLTAKEEMLDRPSEPLFARRGTRRKAHAQTVRDIVKRKPVTAAPGTTLGEAARLMHRRGVGRLPVVDADGHLVGIVTRSDLLSVFLRTDDELETIVRQELADLPRPGGEVEVRVVDGVAELTGGVRYRSEAEMLNRMAQQVPGVVDVRSLVHWDLDDTYVAAGGA